MMRAFKPWRMSGDMTCLRTTSMRKPLDKGGGNIISGHRFSFWRSPRTAGARLEGEGCVCSHVTAFTTMWKKLKVEGVACVESHDEAVFIWHRMYQVQ